MKLCQKFSVERFLCEGMPFRTSIELWPFVGDESMKNESAKEERDVHSTSYRIHGVICHNNITKVHAPYYATLHKAGREDDASNALKTGGSQIGPDCSVDIIIIDDEVWHNEDSVVFELPCSRHLKIDIVSSEEMLSDMLLKKHYDIGLFDRNIASRGDGEVLYNKYKHLFAHAEVVTNKNFGEMDNASERKVYPKMILEGIENIETQPLDLCVGSLKKALRARYDKQKRPIIFVDCPELSKIVSSYWKIKKVETKKIMVRQSFDNSELAMIDIDLSSYGTYFAIKDQERLTELFNAHFAVCIMIKISDKQKTLLKNILKIFKDAIVIER